MKVTVLVENSACKEQCCAVHGLSLHLQTAAHQILFDFGPDGDTLLHNAAALGVSLETVDLAVLSHGHSDHGGGLPAFLERNQTALVYVRSEAFHPYFSRFHDDFYPIGLADGLREHPQVRLSETLETLGDGLRLFASPQGGTLRPLFNSELFTERDGIRIPDDFEHEQSLLLEENGKTVLIGGCAHGGILQLLIRAEELLGRPVDTVISGFHLMAPRLGLSEPEERLAQLAEELAKRPTQYYTCHCTGETAFQSLKTRLGAQLEAVHAGTQLEL